MILTPPDCVAVQDAAVPPAHSLPAAPTLEAAIAPLDRRLGRMRIVCTTNSAAEAPGDAQGKSSHPDYVYEELVGGRVSRVYGMLLVDDRLQYLIDVGWPTWIPALYFDVVDDSVPAGWRFKFYAESPYPAWERRWIQAVWGYDYLIDNSPEHAGGLSEGVLRDLAQFQKEVASRNALDAR